MKSGLRDAFWIGFGLFAAQLAWVLYNTYVPIFLQAGAPDFSIRGSVTTTGFGLSAALTGIIMALDNLAALFIQPLMGPISCQRQLDLPTATIRNAHDGGTRRYTCNR